MARGHGTRQLSGTLLFSLSLALFGPTARADDPPVAQPTATPTPTPTPAPEIRKSESLTVSAIRAEETAPVTKTDISGSVIRKEDNGQEMPTLLSAAPSVTFYSESGGPNGYSYISIRGVQMTRLNLTFDGAPLNDPEDSTFYFANFADFAGSLGSLQIQRGVGTSTWGSASYGGSVSFESVEPSEGFGVAARLGAGSFGTERVGAEVQSGRFGPDLKLWVKASLQDTDGYRDNSGVKQGSLFWGITREVADSAFRLSGFYGREKTQLAFLASEESALEANPRDNPMTPEENDSFWQSLVQAQFTKVLSGVSSLAVQGYFGNAGGTYRVWQDQAANQLFQYGLDWWRAGGALTYRYDGDPVNFTLGGHGSSFVSTHTGGLTDGPEEYENHGYKSEANGFAKVAWNSGPWHLLGDAQVRWAQFRYSGGAGDETKSWVFFNPKIGARFDLSRALSAYASVGRTSREPQRGDLLMGQDDASVLPDFDAVKPEELTDIEAGIDFRTSTVTVHANVYDMEFRNEIALTGELAPTGLPISKNVPRSYRRGFEMDAKWQPLKSLRLGATLNASRNRISSWTQFYDFYDAAGNLTGSVSRTFSDVAPLLTPELVANLNVEWDILPWITLSANGRYVAQSFLDNTNVSDLVTPDFFTLGAGILIDLAGALPGRPSLRIQAENLLNDKRLWPSGYSYLYATADAQGGLTYSGIPYYYPLASRSVMVTLEVGF